MKLLSLSLVLLMAAVAQGQKLSEPTWNFDGAYSCAIGKVCRTPTQKEIDAHKLTGTFSLGAGINWITIDPGPCDGYSFQYDAKTNTCSMTISFDLLDKEPITCTPLTNNSGFPRETMKCSFTPKKGKP